jgi:hypothetical protein
MTQVPRTGAPAAVSRQSLGLWRDAGQMDQQGTGRSASLQRDGRRPFPTKSAGPRVPDTPAHAWAVMCIAWCQSGRGRSWCVPASQRASEDKTEIAGLQAIVIAGQALDVANDTDSGTGKRFAATSRAVL